MDLLQLAQHRFQQLAPILARPMTEETSEAIEHWLRDQVSAAVEPLCRSPRFRRLACWSPDHLQRGLVTPQRRLVMAVDRALVEAARQTADAARELGLLHGTGDLPKTVLNPVEVPDPQTPQRIHRR